MLFFADRGERAVVQGMLIGSVVAVMAALLLLLNGLDKPFHDGVGGLQPVAMERSLRIDRRGARRGRRPGAAPVRRAREAGAVVTTGRRAAATGWSSWRPCCSPSRPSRRRGAATSRPGGTASRRRPAARANALRIESAKAAGLANTQTEIDVATLHAVGQRLRPEADASWRTSTSSASARSSGRPSTPGSRPGRSRTRTRR